MRIIRRWVLIIVAALVMPAYAVGQASSSGSTFATHDAVIKGLVVSANGKRLKKVHVTLVNESTDEKTETATDKSGAFRFASLFAGKYRLEATTGGDETAADEVSLGGNDTVSRKLVVKKPR